ncbi:hypothetical protein CXF83_09890 [Shewanella sp. Choline-02u-19]|uniref:hypothetical protein n=1 Tax=unclassified Shewanella TaxID=196818 RepID=UPI000C32CA77|nr:MULTISPECIES: hypothetical protein [unclassified Shewanella]PKH62860.1 hypothetical protein CXF84_00810 [Shewanella sp. Bg11-22]PKI27017.1 hypothetical protein CXF83_09890 [Shewanella sp. Choline-02u-19]
MLRTILSIVALTLFCSFNTVASEWTKIATKTVNYKSEFDKVEPILFIKSQNFSHIKLKCIKGIVNIENLTITMSDGSTKKLETLGVLMKGISTRPFLLPDDENVKFKSLEMNYKSIGSVKTNLLGISKKGKIEVWAKKRTMKED